MQVEILSKHNEGSNYDRTGQWVIAKYQEQAWITGVVQDSRVKYGGAIQHTIVSDSVTHIGEDIKGSGTIFLVLENHIMHCKELSDV